MATTIQVRRGGTTNRMGITPSAGEPVWDTDEKALYVGDGSTAGGVLVTGDNAVDSVNGQTGTVVLDASDVGAIATSAKGANSGVAELDSSGKVPSSQLPAIAMAEVFVVANESEQLALTAQEGDVAVRTDQNKSYIHNGGTAGTMADWQELLTPTDTVLSVNGETGAVTLDYSDVGAEPAISSGVSTQYWRGDKTWATLNFDAISGVLDGGTF